MSQQAVSADTIPSSAVGIFFPKNRQETKTKAARVLVRWLPHKFRSLYYAHLATLKQYLS
jgi:hypothetical protein